MALKEKANIVTAIVYDFETGGLDCNKCAATQISMHAVRLDTFEVTGTLNLYISPYNKKAVAKPKKKVLVNKYEIGNETEEPMLYEQRAMNVSGITMQMLENNGKPLEEVCECICDFIKEHTFDVTAANKPFLIGQNPIFDLGFLEQIMIFTDMWDKLCELIRGSKDYFGNFVPAQLDTILLNQLAFGNDKSIVTWKLEAMADKLNIDLDDAHDADADVVATQEIVRSHTLKMRSGNNFNISAETTGMLTAEDKVKLRDHFKI